MKQRFRRRAAYLMSAALSLSIIILIAWWLDIDPIKNIFPHTTAMNPTSAVCFIMLCASFLILQVPDEKKPWHRIAYFLAVIPTLAGLLKLLSLMALSNLEIDMILFRDQLIAEGSNSAVNEMAPNTAFNFIFLGIATLLTTRSNQLSKQIASYTVLVTLLISLFAIVGYLYQVTIYNGVLSYIPMALQTAITFVLVGMALLYSNSQHGFMAVITSPYTGGTIARVLIPTAILAPIIIGYIELWNQRTSPVSDELGVSLLITGIVLLFFFMILYVALIINKSDMQRKIAEDNLEQLNIDLEQKIIERTKQVYGNERRYRSLIENSAEGISLLDENLKTTYQSPAALAISGYTLEERSQMQGQDLIHPEDQAEAARSFTMLLKFPDKPQSFQYRGRHKNGEYVWIEGIATNLLNDKDVGSIVINYRDVTARKKSEQEIEANEKRLQAILESSADAIVITDETLSAKYQSPSAERMTGISLAFRLANPGVRYTHPDDVPVLNKLVSEILAHPETPLPFQIRFLHANGEYIWIEGVMTNLLNDKNVKGIAFNYRDVTDRKNLEEQQAANERRFRALIENISDAIVLNDENSNILYQSPSVTRILGYTNEERKGTTVLEYVHPDNKESFKDLYRKLRNAKGQPLPFQYRFLHKTGKYIWLEGVVTNLIHDPAVNAYVANYRDITERKESEEKLLNGRALLRTLIDNIPDYIYVKDTESRHLINNKAMVKLLGASSEEETLGKSSIEFFGAKVATPYLAEDKDIIASGVAKFNFEETTIAPSGEFLYLRTTKVPLIDLQGNTTGLVGISHDITSQKQIELDLRNSKYFLEKAQQVGNTGHWIWDIQDNGKLVMSTEACRIFEIEPGQFDEKIQALYDFTHPDDLALVKSSMESSINNNISYSIDHRIVLKNGNIKWVHEQAETTTSDNGKTLFLIGIIQDITERKKAEEEILNLNAELEERVELRTFQLQAANKEMEAFTYSVSHDLRAPLRIIDGFSQILLEDHADQLDADGKNNLEKIIKNAKRMGRLIDDLLDFSRLGRTEIKVSSIDMNALVQDVLEEIKNSGTKLPDHLEVNALPLSKADYNLLKQVWTNLISNAIKYSGKKKQPEIRIGVITESDKIIYYIKDNGDGFDMQYYSKLFGVFQRLHKESEFTGTGVGLALVQRIILRHGGRVWAEATPGEGATFYFYLPD